MQVKVLNADEHILSITILYQMFNSS